MAQNEKNRFLLGKSARAWCKYAFKGVLQSNEALHMLFFSPRSIKKA